MKDLRSKALKDLSKVDRKSANDFINEVVLAIEQKQGDRPAQSGSTFLQMNKRLLAVGTLAQLIEDKLIDFVHTDNNVDHVELVQTDYGKGITMPEDFQYSELLAVANELNGIENEEPAEE